MMEFSVIVVTHNRAESLRETIGALARLEYPLPWELLVVDNASTDGTRQVVADAVSEFGHPVRYVREPRPGKYTALNTGIVAAKGRFIAATDDDAFPAPDWLDRAADGFAKYACDFVGGPVFPLWRAEPPRWLNPRSAFAGKVLALQDFGREPLEYGRVVTWPLGVNVAYRREVFTRVGLFDGALGRTAGTLRNQSQREWHLRARAAGVRGFYLPGMTVDHVMWPDRLTRAYFRRWFYWHGISRAILYQKTGWDLVEPERGAGHKRERAIAGVPLSIFRKAMLATRSCIYRRLRGEQAEAFEYELWVCFCAGVARQRWRDRRARIAPDDQSRTYNPASDLPRAV